MFFVFHRLFLSYYMQTFKNMHRILYLDYNASTHKIYRIMYPSSLTTPSKKPILMNIHNAPQLFHILSLKLRDWSFSVMMESVYR